jgi:hypothetical protein
MRWPWISRLSHEQIVTLLTSQVSDLRREREILLDRLGTIGLGGPLYNLPSQQDSSPNTEEEEELIDPNEEVKSLIARFRHRPSRLASAITRKNVRDYNKLWVGPSVAWVPDASKAMAALDAAEELGKKQA